MSTLAAVVFLIAATGLAVACWALAGPPPNFGDLTSTRRRRPAITAAIWTGLAAGLVTGGCGPTAAADPGQPAPAPPAADCYEDQPCWDCTTMGNRQCGPPPAPAPPRAGGPTCYGQPVPLDPRITVADPVGTLVYRAMLDAICGPTTTEETR